MSFLLMLNDVDIVQSLQSLQCSICSQADAWTNMKAQVTNGIMEAGARVHLDTVVGELITGDQHLGLFLFHSPLLVGIRMRVQELGDAWMLCCNCFIQGCPSPEVPIKG